MRTASKPSSFRICAASRLKVPLSSVFFSPVFSVDFLVVEFLRIAAIENVLGDASEDRIKLSQRNRLARYRRDPAFELGDHLLIHAELSRELRLIQKQELAHHGESSPALAIEDRRDGFG